MKPSSSNSDPASGGLFDGVLARGPVRDAVSDRAWLQAMLDVEAALARAQAGAGADLDRDEAEAIARACRAEDFDVAAIGRDAADSGNPVVPLVPRAPSGGGGSVRRGRRASRRDQPGHRGLRGDAGRASRAGPAARGPHRRGGCRRGDRPPGIADTLMAGRTLLQHALPTTFGCKAAGWTVALDEAAERLDVVRRTRLAAQLGGAAGTLASLGEDGIAVLARVRGGPRPGRAGDRVAHGPNACRRAGRGAGRGRRSDREGRARRGAHGADRGGRGPRGGAGARRLVDAAAQAQPGGGRRRDRRRGAGAGARGHAARRDDPGTRARRGFVACRVEAAHRTARDRRLVGRVDPRLPRASRGRRREDAGATST